MSSSIYEDSFSDYWPLERLCTRLLRMMGVQLRLFWIFGLDFDINIDIDIDINFISFDDSNFK